MFATTFSFEAMEATAADTATTTPSIPNAGAIFCSEAPQYLGPIPPSEHHDTREVAFVGRSNVGKSSLVGALFKEPSMVRSSKTPGRTRETLFFALGDRTHLPWPLLLVDLPGYGYARVGKNEQEDWEEKMQLYLIQRSSEQLKRVFVLGKFSLVAVLIKESCGWSISPCCCCFFLVDARREGMTERDIGMATFLNAHNVQFQLVLTKCDSVHSKEVARVAALIVEQAWAFQHCVREIIAVSAKKERGLVELRNAVLRSTGYTGKK